MDICPISPIIGSDEGENRNPIQPKEPNDESQTMKAKQIVTPTGIAAILYRGIEAAFDNKYRPEETEYISDFLYELATALRMEATEMAGEQAEENIRHADFLEEIAGALAEKIETNVQGIER